MSRSRRRCSTSLLFTLPFFTLLLFAAPVRPATLDTVAFAAEVEAAMSAWQVPGAAVAVIEDGELVFKRGFGTAAIDAATPVDSDTFFINASTTKAMLAAGLLILVDEEGLHLDDPLVEYLPEVRFAEPSLTPQITLRDLLTHRTGLPSTNFWTFNQGMSITEQIPLLQHVQPVEAPRARKIYQNTMYELLGLVIERVTGKPWETFLSQRLWRPIGMETVATRAAIPDERLQARPYALFDGQIREVNHSLRAEVSDAAGSAWSTIDDMVLWMQFLLRGGVTAQGERLLPEAAIDEMFRPQQLVHLDDYYPSAALTEPHWISYGLGWYQQDFQGRKIDYHTGSLNGAVAIVGLDRQSGRAIAFMANRGGAELRHALLWSVMDQREGSAKPDWQGDVLSLYEARRAKRIAAYEETIAARLDTPLSLPLASYSGRYAAKIGGPISICVDGEALRLDTLVRHYRLTPWHSDVFLLEHEDWERGDFARFALTARGTIAALDAFGMEFERLDESDEPAGLPRRCTEPMAAP